MSDVAAVGCPRVWAAQPEDVGEVRGESEVTWPGLSAVRTEGPRPGEMVRPSPRSQGCGFVGRGPAGAGRRLWEASSPPPPVKRAPLLGLVGETEAGEGRQLL